MTIFKLRAAGMSLNRIPLFVWGAIVIWRRSGKALPLLWPARTGPAADVARKSAPSRAPTTATIATAMLAPCL